MTCLITGCTFLDPRYPRAVHGDLHLVGQTFVFNACLAGGEAAWNYEPRVMEGSIHLTFEPGADGCDYFERRGVIVFPTESGALSPAAEAYIGERN